VRRKGTYRCLPFAVEVGLTPTDLLVMSGAFSPAQTTGPLGHLHEETMSGTIELNQGRCNTIRAEHDKARKDSAVLIAEDAIASQAFIYKENVA
jgi:hypothetical protein